MAGIIHFLPTSIYIHVKSFPRIYISHVNRARFAVNTSHLIQLSRSNKSFPDAEGSIDLAALPQMTALDS